MRRFGMQRSKAYQRLAALVDHGIVIHDQGVRSSRVFLATSKGLAVCGLDLPLGCVSPATATHDLAVVDAAVPLEASAVRVVLTEREIRRHDRSGSTKFRIAAPDASGGADARGMWPDLVVVDRLTGKLHAIEVELTMKKHERIVDKLRAYLVSGYETITYQCASAGIARAVAQARTSTGLGDRLSVERLNQATGPLNSIEEVERLLETLRRERQRATEQRECAEGQARRADEAMRLLENERRTCLAIVDDIVGYLSAGRAEQRTILERWRLLADRVERGRATDHS